MHRIASVFLIVCFALSGCARHSHCGSTSTRTNFPTIMAEGEARIEVRADLLVVSFAIREIAETPQAAIERAAETERQVRDGLGQTGLSSLALTPIGFSMGPHRVRVEDEYVERGFEVSNDFEIRVREHEKISDIVVALSRAGVKGEVGVDALLEDASAVRKRVIQAAVGQARADAEISASALGVRLGHIDDFQVINVNDGSQSREFATVNFSYVEPPEETHVSVNDQVWVDARVKVWIRIVE